MAYLRTELLGQSVVITTEDAVAAERIAVAYQHFPKAIDCPEAVNPLHASLTADADRWIIKVDGRPDRIESDRIAAIRGLHHETMHGVMERCRRYVYVHAGVVEWEGRALVFPGVSHAGKSTLTLAMVRAGARFLSDELLVFDPTTGCAVPYPRAMKIRDCCVHYFADIAPHFVGDGEARYLKSTGKGVYELSRGAPLGMVVTAKWNPDRPTALSEIGAGRAFLALTQSALNFGSHGTRTIDHLADLVAGAKCRQLSWRNAQEAVRALTAAFSGS